MLATVKSLKCLSNALNLRFFSRTGVNFNEKVLKNLKIGAKSFVEKSFSLENVKTFAALSGDFNPIHLDENFIQSTKYKKLIVHGMLVNSLLPTSYLNFFSIFLVFVDNKVIAESEVRRVDGLKVTIDLKCYSPDLENPKVYIKGETTVLVSKNAVRDNRLGKD
ncbi:hypothetical protein HELRODRAFT_175453 [Helobdella robusta]|uniref:MaoC-like domain-containing protein n=1 Tax=Helobdella robusta TaxID=6412 RepID=T1F997_HELRO|nr:hypothetical protein HELRODRAFT_175453 [Helobdella robusta]ESO00950.1 hypothetical protein HELRODRAFT_175453 [Helobdella robusta]